MTPPIIPRWYQSESVEKVFSFYDNGGQGNSVLALPTGTGKSLVVAMLLIEAFRRWSNCKWMMLTHNSNLVQQNGEELLKLWPLAPMGFCNGEMKRYDTHYPIVFGTVQTAINYASDFGFVNVLLVDECHLISDDESSQYLTLIEELKKINPNLIVIGLSATPFRMKMGMITDGPIFDQVIYDVTAKEMFNRMITDGFLSPLVPPPENLETHFDLSNVGLRGGEYAVGPMAEVFGDKPKMTASIREFIHMGENRRSWVGFGSSIENCEMIAEIMRAHGIPAAAYHSKTKDHKAIMQAFKAGQLRCLISKEKLTTGFNHRPIDLIGVWRRTMSPGLWVQMLGRGTRLSPETGKQNCMVADFGRNTARLGPINDPVLPGKRRPKKEPGDAPVKLCPQCQHPNYTTAKTCGFCGHEFPTTERVDEEASRAELIAKTEITMPIYEDFPVHSVVYTEHTKRSTGAKSLKVRYISGIRSFDEYVPLENEKAKHLARQWWTERSRNPIPETVQDALAQKDGLRIPSSIRVHTNHTYNGKIKPQIVRTEY